MNRKYNYKKGKKRFVCIALIAIFFQVISLLPAIGVKAQEITNKFQFITQVKLTGNDGKPINESSNPVSKNSEVKLTYKFNIPNNQEVKKGDHYTMQIPKEIKIISKLNFPIILDNGDKIADVTIDTDGKVNIVFTEFAENNSNVSGFFYIDTQFNPDQIGNDNPVRIEFDLGGDSGPNVIEVNFEQPEAPKASIKKDGSYDPLKNEITWKITVNPENVKVNNPQVVDNILEGQEFIPGSVKINGAYAKSTDYNYQNKKLTCNFGEVIDRQQIITFKTKVIDPKISQSEGATTYEYNKAILNHDGTSKESNEASIKVVTDFINKNGSYDPVTKRINWIINVNNNAQHIENAIVIDSIPQGLELTAGSVKLDGASSNSYKVEGQKFIYTFEKEINEPHTITFSTDVVDPNAYNSNVGKEYKNKVDLEGKGVPDNATDSKGINVPTSIIEKQGIGYNPATGEITWKVTINNNKISIKNPVVTDDIRIGQEYVQGSASIEKGTAKGSFKYEKADGSDKLKTGTLIYTFNDAINEIHTITFKTRVTDPNVYAGNRNENYFNVAKLEGDNIIPSTSQGRQNVQSQVIQKIGRNFDYIKREFTWEIIINRNGMTLPNAYVTDITGDKQEFVDNSVMINGKPAEKSNYNYDKDTKTLRYNFPSEIKTHQILTFKTRIADSSIFNTNGEKEFKNTAKLITDIVPGSVESTGKVKVKNALIDKNSDYTRGNDYIDWNVTVNSNKILIKNAVLTDILQEGLELDTTSIKLYKAMLNSNGSLSMGEEITLGKDDVKYNAITREFNFQLPSSTSEAYILTFRTNVVDKKKSPFTNTISFKGTGITEKSDSNKVDVIFQGAGGGGVGETGSIKVVKVNKNNENDKLQGTVFELLDKYQNVIKTSEPTGVNGDVIFNKLKFDIDYYVKEKTPPQGYLISDEVYKFQVENSKEQKNISYNYKDEKIKGEIKFVKTGHNDTPLQGAEFTLYSISDIKYENPLAIATSDMLGIVHFKDVEYGEYIIKETKAPEGYNISTETLKANITENGKIVKPTPESISNTKIKGNIEFTKQGDNKKPLQGAQFKLYKEWDNNFKDPIAVAVSDENGYVQFKDVEYGKYNIKETKAPEGYAISGKVLTAEITQHGSTVKSNPNSISNTRIRGNVEVKKLGEDKNALKGGEFTLYNTQGEAIKTSVSGEDGIAIFKDLQYGEYTIKETKAPEGYNISNEILKASIKENGTTVKANPYSISNTKIRGNIEFTKQGEDKKLLQGAEFKIYEETDEKFEKPIQKAISDENGHVEFKNIEYGNYNIKETKAPRGYNISHEVLKVSIKENGKVVKVNPEIISNTKIRGHVSVKKLDKYNRPLKGAEFALYNVKGEAINTSISGEDGIAIFRDLIYGEYTIKETKAPEGYLVSEGDIKVFVNEDGKLYIYEVINNRIKGTVLITKTDMKEKLLQGAEFTLFDDKGKKIASSISDKNGVSAFKDVDYGKYTIKETKAPKGYNLSEKKLEININSPEIQKFTLKNEPEKLINKIINNPSKNSNKEGEAIVNGASDYQNKINDLLPKTGGWLDFKGLMTVGSLTTISGVILFLKKNKKK
ncbi:SpaA isopeptide-forming pilin-related protein [Clostridium sp. Marseille-Q2269]|uniref:SpaA isopeptide-forming pilin-related protein n=1 Tax=Clostridium sp. Marseille-Q2269 TaxID=2942205 RepID=UPI002072D104|nr:SpaA isopeptide-forming pilin-related protein [Clostridium sp. Marseille-Q2269]